MNERQIFHLSIPVSDLAPAKRFYVDVLGARTGRENDEWLDILLWGHQITLQRRPEEVVPLERQGKRHFGVILPWVEWEHEVARIRALGVPFVSEPAVLLSGTRSRPSSICRTRATMSLRSRRTGILLTRSVLVGSRSRMRGPINRLETDLRTRSRGSRASAA